MDPDPPQAALGGQRYLAAPGADLPQQPGRQQPGVVYAAPEGLQIRDLTLDPYAQKLYWLDPTTEGRLDLLGRRRRWSSGRAESLPGSDARGLIVRPYENALYYVRWQRPGARRAGRQQRDKPGRSEPPPYTGLRLPVEPTVFAPTYIIRPSGNLAFVIATPFAAPALRGERQPRAQQQRGHGHGDRRGQHDRRALHHRRERCRRTSTTTRSACPTASSSTSP